MDEQIKWLRGFKMEEQLKDWDYAYVKSLPDSAFLYTKKVGDKVIRKLPYKDKSGKVDLPHLRNAITRLAQSKTDIPESEKKRLLAKARKILEDMKKESQSMEEDKMPNDEKEQLYRDVNPKMQAEIAAKKAEGSEAPKEEAPVEEKVDEAPSKKEKKSKSKEKLADEEEAVSEEDEKAEESAEEEKEPEAPEEKEDVATEEKVEESEEKSEESDEKAEEPSDEATEEKEEEPQEELSEDIDANVKETKEELSVIKEVRDELVALYARNNELQNTVEKLTEELDALKKEKKEVSEQLQKYVDAEARINAKKHQERLEALSKKFKLLGQEKTVEQLSEKDEETLSEFEKIVDAALDVAAENSEKLSETEPSQGEEVKAESDAEPEEAPKEELKQEAKAEPSKEQFFAGILNKMAETQHKSGRKRVQYF